jgi:post-segregation antitoxin (ccd killing protein)
MTDAPQNKTIVTVKINEDLLNKALALGIDINEVAERALRQLMEEDKKEAEKNRPRKNVANVPLGME